MNKNKTTKLLASLTFHLVTSYQAKNTRLADELGLTEAEFRCLRSLRSDKGLNHTKVAKRMYLTASRVTRITEGLEEKGYLTKGHDRKDWRSLILTLSRKGRLFMLKLDKQNIDIHRRILNNIKSSQHKALILAMENLNSAAEKGMRKSKLLTTH